MQSIFTHLINRNENALQKSLDAAPPDFNRDLSQSIASQTLQCLDKVK